MAKHRNRDAWVSASKAGRASYCPHYLELERKGAQVSSKAQAARVKGDHKHEILNTKAEDKRCYVASHLYGIDDTRTKLLRDFRDQRLKKGVPGRLFISVYYRLSPFLVSIARKHPTIDRVVRKTVDHIVNGLEQGMSDG